MADHTYNASFLNDQDKRKIWIASLTACIKDLHLKTIPKPLYRGENAFYKKGIPSPILYFANEKGDAETYAKYTPKTISKLEL